MSIPTSGRAASLARGSDDHRSIGERLQDHALVEAALVAAYRAAVAEHLRTGEPLVVWRDGQVVEVSAEEAAAQLGLRPGERACTAEDLSSPR